MALTACAELYGKAISEGAMSLWWQSLERFDIELVEKAFRAAVEDPESGQFMPKPADIIKRIDGTQTDRALIAWGKVLDAIRRVGAYQTVGFDDGVIHNVIIDMGGWPTVCRSQIEELPFLQRRFCDTYRAYAVRPNIEFPAKLIGESEQANSGKGYRAPAPVLIGDQEKAAKVVSIGMKSVNRVSNLIDALPQLCQKQETA
jgi:hypothetical protein